MSSGGFQPFEVVQLRNGAKAVRHQGLDEVMHPSVGPWKEANVLYIEQSGLKDALGGASGEPLRIYDVGLGAGANAAAALTCAADLGGKRRELQLVSFELDLGAARLALSQPEAFPFLIPWKAAFESLLSQGSFGSEGVVWQLFQGDALEAFSRSPRPAHIVFYDPFSPQSNPSLWTPAAFSALRRCCADEGHPEGSVVITYSASTSVRAAMLLAGFYVGYGAPIGSKLETTIASTRLDLLKRPLDDRWLERCRRSSAALPQGVLARDELDKALVAHPQFKAG